MYVSRRPKFLDSPTAIYVCLIVAALSCCAHVVAARHLFPPDALEAVRGDLAVINTRYQSRLQSKAV
jgi:hypothetical protein